MWQPLALALFGLCLIALLYGYKLGSLVPLAPGLETNVTQSVPSVRVIVDNPVNAPYKAASYITYKLNSTPTTQRVVSAAAAALMVVLFFVIASSFTTRYVASLGTLLFASSSSLLTSGRQAGPSIMLLTLFALVACGYALRFNANNDKAWILTCAAIGLSLYVPGMLYFLIAGGIWQYRSVRRPFSAPRPLLTGVCVAIIAASLVPIITSLVRDPGLWNDYLGIPDTLPSITKLLATAAYVPLGIFLISPENPLTRLGRQPMLDIFTSLMVVLGCYSLIIKRTLDRTKLLIGVFIVGGIWTTISVNHENLLVLLPFIYLIATVGIGWLLRQWLKVFPRNPLARLMAMVLVTTCVLLSCNFQLRRYFIAWPNSPSTVAAFKNQSD